MVCAAWVTTAHAAVGDTFLEYAKLTAPTSGPSAEIGGGELGGAAFISADGTTAITGAFDDASGTGAAYVFTRAGTAWTLQAKLTAPTTGANRALGTNTEFGNEVALSADGNTAIVGGFGDNSDAGAAWVYTRGASGWTVQQKLTAPTSGADRELAPGEFGSRISLNAAGTTALIAGVEDGAFVGAAWTYTRPSTTATTWTEQHKLTAPTSGTGREVGAGDFGSAVWLSPDGTTAVIGGDGDSSSVGAAWVYANSGGTWTEQTKLVPPTTGPDAGVGTPTFGSAVSLSADASTALIGGQSDNQRGAAWLFTRTTATTWSERQKLVAPSSGAGAEIGQGFFGAAAVLSSDATTAVVGAPIDNSAVGAAYAYARSGATWSLQGKLTAPTGTDAEIGSAVFGAHLALSGDATTLLISGQADNNLAGAVWSYRRHDATDGLERGAGGGAGARRHCGRDPWQRVYRHRVRRRRIGDVRGCAGDLVSRGVAHRDRRHRAPARRRGRRRHRGRPGGRVAGCRRRPVPLCRRSGRPDERRHDGRQPPRHRDLQAASRHRSRHLPGDRVARRRPGHRDPEPRHGEGPAQRQAVSLPHLRHQRRWHEPIGAADPRGGPVRAAQAVRGVDPGRGPPGSARRLHRDRRPALTQACVGVGDPAARPAPRRAPARRARAGRRPHAAWRGHGQARGADDQAEASRAAHRRADRRARALGHGVAGQSRPAPSREEADRRR